MPSVSAGHLELVGCDEEPAAAGATEVALAKDTAIVLAAVAIQLQTDPLTSCEVCGPDVADGATLPWNMTFSPTTLTVDAAAELLFGFWTLEASPVDAAAELLFGFWTLEASPVDAAAELL
eukprot:CAMPEP_0180624702 /NCGR_PEP_ID=MMETSP1037_2-20121125/36914_1 /TAXON_ID=632150 /ORGANISM="Azadinium spinosum, Strain 3D9" /LENGTH=120 /DNA_ID=CAMNT_0022645145 /DNA_START=102 /DNA_END=463 /DNA_ORIENTATION=-